MKLLSIIIPVYNAVNYFIACLDSIVQQSALNIEVVIVNDGSTDNSGNIANNYAQRYDFIKVIHQRNQGVSTARNRAIQESTGEYLVFLDSDDVLYKNFFQKVLDVVKSQPDIIEINADLIDEKGTLLYQKVFLLKKNKTSLKDTDVTKLILSKQAKYYLWSRIIKKELVKHLYFDEKVSFCEDALYLTECYFKAEKIITINESLYGYRQHDTNVTLVRSIQNINELANLCNIVKDKIVNSQDNDYKKFLFSLLINMTHLRKSMYALEFKKIACDDITIAQIKDIIDCSLYSLSNSHNNVAWIRRFSLTSPRLSNSMILLKSYIKGE